MPHLPEPPLLLPLEELRATGLTSAGFGFLMSASATVPATAMAPAMPAATSTAPLPPLGLGGGALLACVTIIVGSASDWAARGGAGVRGRGMRA